jgi:hypothetical protein
MKCVFWAVCVRPPKTRKFPAQTEQFASPPAFFPGRKCLDNSKIRVTLKFAAWLFMRQIIFVTQEEK